MTRMFLDIETLPAPESERTILQTLYQKKLEKKAKYLDSSQNPLGEIKDHFEEYFKNSTFDGSFGRILCIAYALDDQPTQVICNPENERQMLMDFWAKANQVDQFIGHNILEFDLRFIYQRSVKLMVRPSWKLDGQGTHCLNFARYRSFPIYDTMKEWTKWGVGSVGLEHIALALGIPTPKDGIDGSQVYDFYKNGKIKEICDYCMRDVDTTRLLYKRMTFS